MLAEDRSRQMISHIYSDWLINIYQKKNCLSSESLVEAGKKMNNSLK